MAFAEACGLNEKIKLKKKILFLEIIFVLEFSLKILEEDGKSLDFFSAVDPRVPTSSKKLPNRKCKNF